jgi:hypothetical protein
MEKPYAIRRYCFKLFHYQLNNEPIPGKPAQAPQTYQLLATSRPKIVPSDTLHLSWHIKTTPQQEVSVQIWEAPGLPHSIE